MAGDTIRLRVERMAYGADAIAHRDDGKTVFVSGAVAGDLVDAVVDHEGKGFDHAVAQALVKPSPDRVDVPCPYAAVCGGCPWAALSREAQLAAKRANVVDSLARLGHLPADEAEALVAPCERPSGDWGYRNKVELGFERQGKRAIVGMHGRDDASLIKVDRCLLLESRYQKAVKSVSGALSYLTGSRGINLQRVGVRASSRTRQVEVALWTEPSPFPRAQAAKIVGESVGATSVVRVLVKGPQKARRVSGMENLAGLGHWEEHVGGESMALSAPSFFQVNTRGAERLQELVLQGLDVQDDDEAMDLYCGAGTFTLPLARRAAWVDAVEAYGPAVRDLRRNLDHAGLDNVDPVGGDAGREFPETEADVIVVDPPRAGLAEDVVAKLSRQPARAIAYVSCDPATLARDLARFREEGAFAPASVTPVDLFPQTYHVETVTILRRRSR